MAQQRRYYKQGERIWIKTLSKTGLVQSLDIPNLEAKVSYLTGNMNEDGKAEIAFDVFKFDSIDKLHTKEDSNSNSKSTSKRLTILIRYFDEKYEGLTRIEKIEQGDWIDLRSAITVEYKAGESIKLPLGIAMSLPFDYEAHMAPRGSTFKNFGVIQTNSVGVVDESYRGNEDEWFLPLYALRDGKIEKGDRICQFRIMEKMQEVNVVEVDKLNAPNRGGEGSTGIK